MSSVRPRYKMCKNIEFGYFVNPAATGASEINLQNQKKKKNNKSSTKSETQK